MLLLLRWLISSRTFVIPPRKVSDVESTFSSSQAEKHGPPRPLFLPLCTRSTAQGQSLSHFFFFFFPLLFFSMSKIIAHAKQKQKNKTKKKPALYTVLARAAQTISTQPSLTQSVLRTLSSQIRSFHQDCESQKKRMNRWLGPGYCKLSWEVREPNMLGDLTVQEAISVHDSAVEATYQNFVDHVQLLEKHQHQHQHHPPPHRPEQPQGGGKGMKSNQNNSGSSSSNKNASNATPIPVPKVHPFLPQPSEMLHLLNLTCVVCLGCFPPPDFTPALKRPVSNAALLAPSLQKHKSSLRQIRNFLESRLSTLTALHSRLSRDADAVFAAASQSLLDGFYYKVDFLPRPQGTNLRQAWRDCNATYVTTQKALTDMTDTARRAIDTHSAGVPREIYGFAEAREEILHDAWYKFTTMQHVEGVGHEQDEQDRNKPEDYSKNWHCVGIEYYGCLDLFVEIKTVLDRLDKQIKDMQKKWRHYEIRVEAAARYFWSVDYEPY